MTEQEILLKTLAELEELRAQNKALQEKLAQLEKEVSTPSQPGVHKHYRTLSKDQVQKIKEHTIKVGVNTSIKAPKFKTSKMTSDEVWAMYHAYDQTRFLQRCAQQIGIASEEEAEYYQKFAILLGSMSKEQLQANIRFFGLHSTWYDSDSSWNTSELGGGWTFRRLYISFGGKD